MIGNWGAPWPNREELTYTYTWALTARREIMKSYIMRRCGKFPNGFDRRFGHQTEKCMCCPLCDHQFSKPSWVGSTFYRGKEFTYVECLFCNSLYCDPMPDGETLSQMYGTDYQSGFVDEASDDGSRDGRRIIELLKEVERGVFVDYGCGAGSVLTEAMKIELARCRR